MTHPIDLEAITARNAERRRLKAGATPGTWVAGWGTVHTDDDSVKDSMIVESAPVDYEDPAFIAAAHNDPVEEDVDALIAEIARLRGLLEARGGQITAMRIGVDPKDRTRLKAVCATDGQWPMPEDAIEQKRYLCWACGEESPDPDPDRAPTCPRCGAYAHDE